MKNIDIDSVLTADRARGRRWVQAAAEKVLRF